MTTCIFDGMYGTDGDDHMNWTHGKMPRKGDDVIISGNMETWDHAPAELESITVLDGGHHFLVSETCKKSTDGKP